MVPVAQRRHHRWNHPGPLVPGAVRHRLLRRPTPRLTALGSHLVFAVDDGVHGSEPWSSDGTPGGTALLRDVFPGPAGSGVTSFTAAAGQLYFAADDGTHGFEPWRTDGTRRAPASCRTSHPRAPPPIPPASPSPATSSTSAPTTASPASSSGRCLSSGASLPAERHDPSASTPAVFAVHRALEDARRQRRRRHRGAPLRRHRLLLVLRPHQCRDHPEGAGRPQPQRSLLGFLRRALRRRLLADGDRYPDRPRPPLFKRSRAVRQRRRHHRLRPSGRL